MNQKDKDSGAPGEIRTPDLLLRRQSLYPAELRARGKALFLEYHPAGQLPRFYVPKSGSTNVLCRWGGNGMFTVYVLRSKSKGSFYTESTSNLTQRLERHNANLNRSTKNRGPWEVVYTEVFA